jgi:hypothetical protein
VPKIDGCRLCRDNGSTNWWTRSKVLDLLALNCTQNATNLWEYIILLVAHENDPCLLNSCW